MRTARTFGAFVTFGLLAVLAGGGVGCHRADCSSIAAGTPTTELPLVSWTDRGVAPPAPYPGQGYGYCQPVASNFEMTTLACCTGRDTSHDGGVLECTTYWFHGVISCTDVAPAEFYFLSADSYGGDCLSDMGREFCGVWVRDGRVVGACGQCEDY